MVIIACQSVFASNEQNQQLAEKIAYGRAVGAIFELMYRINPTKTAEMFHWNVDTQAKNVCVQNMANDNGYVKFILPDVQKFANTQKPEQIKSYITRLDNGLSESTRVAYMDALTHKSTITSQQTDIINGFWLDKKLTEFYNFYTYGVISSQQFSEQKAYKLGLQFGKQELLRFSNYINKVCNLNS